MAGQRITTGINDARLLYIMVLAPRRTHLIEERGVRRGVIPAHVMRNALSVNSNISVNVMQYMFVLALTLTTFGLQSFGLSQEINRAPHSTSNTYPNLYARAVSIFLDTVCQKYGWCDSLRYFDGDPSLQGHIPERVGACRIKWLYADTNFLKEMTVGKRTIPVTKIFPLVNKGDTLEVYLSDYYFTVEEDTSRFALEGGCIVRFKYDCKTKQFIVLKTELWGV